MGWIVIDGVCVFTHTCTHTSHCSDAGEECECMDSTVHWNGCARLYALCVWGVTVSVNVETCAFTFLREWGCMCHVCESKRAAGERKR